VWLRGDELEHTPRGRAMPIVRADRRLFVRCVLAAAGACGSRAAGANNTLSRGPLCPTSSISTDDELAFASAVRSAQEVRGGEFVSLT
jgi:hypothetical protein